VEAEIGTDTDWNGSDLNEKWGAGTGKRVRKKPRIALPGEDGLSLVDYLETLRQRRKRPITEESEEAPPRKRQKVDERE
jgi:hypothetical protein